MWEGEKREGEFFLLQRGSHGFWALFHHFAAFSNCLSPPIEREEIELSLRIPIRASETLFALPAAAICFGELASDVDADEVNALATPPLPPRARPPRASAWSIEELLNNALLLLLLLLALGEEQEEARAGGSERIVLIQAEMPEKNAFVREHTKVTKNKKNSRGKNAPRSSAERPSANLSSSVSSLTVAAW